MGKQHCLTTPDELFITGCRHHENGALEKALDIYEKILNLGFSSPLLYYNIGLVLQERGNFEEAISFYHQGAQQSPNDVDILFNMALCYQKINNRKKALVTFKKADAFSPGDPDILYNMGCCYQQDNNEKEAITSYEKALLLDGNHPSALSNLAYLYHKKGCDDKALHLYQRLVQVQPDHQGAIHMLASLSGSQKSDMPKDYIQDVFDSYSNHYEASLVNELKYDVPGTLRRFYDTTFQVDRPLNEILDLGCGTGLSGLAFHDLSIKLTGVDLSANMIAVAEKKQIYKQLVIMDILDFLRNDNKSYDLIIAADVMSYIGDLGEIFKLTYNAGRQGCVFCFSTERTAGPSFCLGSTGRFQHSSSYLQQTAVQAGWQLVLQKESNLRMERGAWVPGNITLLIK